MLEGSTSIGMEYGPRAEAGLLTSQRVIEEMFQDIVMNGTAVKTRQRLPKTSSTICSAHWDKKYRFCSTAER